MTHLSPAVYVFWSCLSTCLVVFLVYHLYKFDHFRSLRWGQQTRSGAFKRVMTFTYLVSVPLLVSYSIGMAVVKYREGYSQIIGFGIIPTPYELWSPEDLRLMTPLAMIFSVAWSLEIVSHLEELCFWLFLTSAGSSRSSWFGSIHFKVWGLGSIISVVGLPLTTWLKRKDPLVCEAWTFLFGSSGSLLITLISLRVIHAIPKLVSQVKSAGGEPEVIVRLSTFHDLNVKRLIFRFIFVIAMFIMAVDGMTPHRHLNENYLWTGADLLASLGGVGMVTSSMLTLLIFFPRSIEREAGYKPRGRTATAESNGQPRTGVSHNMHGSMSRLADNAAPKGTNSEIHVTTHTTSYIELQDTNSGRGRTQVWEMVTLPDAEDKPNRSEVAPFEYQTKVVSHATSNPPPRPPRRELHPLLMNYTSPINLLENSQNSRGTSYGYV